MKQFSVTGYNIYKRALFCGVLLFMAAASFAESKLFPVPDIIKPNVEFWIRIYTEISLEEGLLHDRDYPQIIYENVKSGGRKGKTLSDHIDNRRKIYVQAIANVRENPESTWGPNEKKISQLFKLAPEGALADAENRIRHQTGQRERFKQGVERSAMYLDTISAILKQHGVPDELKYLPHVESSFDAEAYSKVGAAGLWQFMRSTGRSYMRIDYMFDERRDAIISSKAAAKFLRANYNMLKEWPLVITAYNHGPNGIRRAVATVGSSDIAEILAKHDSPTFKFASRNFYSCFLAVLEIVGNTDKYIKDIQYKPKFEASSIKLPFAIRPDALCKSLGITRQEFERLNPSLRPVVFSQQKPLPAGYSVNIPVSIDGKEALASLNRTPQPQRPAQRETEYGDYYTVASGDNLHNIARRLGVTVRELADANNITNQSKIYVGQVLLIPSAAIVVAAVSADTVTGVLKDTVTAVSADSVTAVSGDTAMIVLADNTPTVSAESAPAKRESRTAEKAPVNNKKPAPPAPEFPTFTVKEIPKTARQSAPSAADSVKAVAQMPETSYTASLPAGKMGTFWNPHDTVKAPLAFDFSDGRAAIMTAGQEPISAAVAFSEAVPEPVTDSKRKPSPATYFDAAVYDLGMTVAPGAMSVKIKVSVDETISHFAEWMNVSASGIRRLNNLSQNSGLQMGRSISIPIGRSSDIKKFDVSRLEYHMAIEEDFFARYAITDFESKKVKSGESLWRICNDARIPLWLLKKFNRSVDVFALKPNDVIWLPKVTPKDSHDVPQEDFEAQEEQNGE